MGILNRAPAPIDTDRPAAADFVRVLATWAVGAFHIWQQSWYGGAAPAHWLRAGSVGVDLLVMLSAFCLFLPWANAAVRNQPFAAHPPGGILPPPRALRLLPAYYYVSLLFSLVLAVARRGWSKALALDLAAHLALTQQLYRPAYLACQLNGVTWTLTVFCTVLSRVPAAGPALRKMAAAHAGCAETGAAGGITCCCCRSTAAETILPGSTSPRRSAGAGRGLAAAWVFAKFAHGGWAQHVLPRAGCMALGLAALIWLDAEMRAQAAAAEYQQFQLINRMPLVPLRLRRCWCALAWA